MDSPKFRCFQAIKTEDGKIRTKIQSIGLADLPAGEVVIRVHWSSLNYKDALGAQGHPGVAGPLPHVPGIDAAGVVESSADERYQTGDPVVVTGYELGAPAWGGWSEYIRVPAEWVVPLPSNLDLRAAMVLGTAGFTAAQCVRELQTNGVQPEAGPVLVTGATGGVGVFAVRLLSHLGYQVHAVSGKEECYQSLRELGASDVLPRSVLQDHPKRPLLSAKWAGGIDTVGGEPLVAFLKSLRVNGCVAACGLVAGDQLPTTVYPFILRGVKLAGVTSALCPRIPREAIWTRLANEWRVTLDDRWVEQVSLTELPQAIERISAGKIAGRVVVEIAP